jgi:hypothetical protein
MAPGRQFTPPSWDPVVRLAASESRPHPAFHLLASACQYFRRVVRVEAQVQVLCATAPTPLSQCRGVAAGICVCILQGCIATLSSSGHGSCTANQDYSQVGGITAGTVSLQHVLTGTAVSVLPPPAATARRSSASRVGTPSELRLPAAAQCQNT